jgi:hypothetical protein
MSFEDRLRDHLEDVAVDLEVADGSPTSVQLRAGARSRRRMVVGSTAVGCVVLAVTVAGTLLVRDGQGPDEVMVSASPPVTVSMSTPISEDVPVTSVPASLRRSSDVVLVTTSIAVPGADPDDPDDPSTGHSGALQGAQVTTTKPIESPLWVQLPVGGQGVEFTRSSATVGLVGLRGEGRWFELVGQELAEIEIPAGVAVLALAQGPEGLVAVGQVADGSCGQRLVFLVEGSDGQWAVTELARPASGLSVLWSNVDIAVAGTVVALAITQESRLTGACMAQHLGMEVPADAEFSLGPDLLELRDPQGEVLASASLAALGLEDTNELVLGAHFSRAARAVGQIGGVLQNEELTGVAGLSIAGVGERILMLATSPDGWRAAVVDEGLVWLPLELGIADAVGAQLDESGFTSWTASGVIRRSLDGVQWSSLEGPMVDAVSAVFAVGSRVVVVSLGTEDVDDAELSNESDRSAGTVMGSALWVLEGDTWQSSTLFSLIGNRTAAIDIGAGDGTVLIHSPVGYVVFELGEAPG